MIKNIIGWAVGGFITLLGAMSLLTDPITGLILITIGVSLLPPFRVFMFEKTKINLSQKNRKYLYAASAIIAVISISNNATNEMNEKNRLKEIARQEQIKQAKQLEKEAIEKRSQHFIKNKVTILKKLKKLLKEKQYSKGIKEANQYTQTNDKELLTITNKLRSGEKALIVRNKTNSILKELKSVPASDIKTNHRLYKELASLHPKNKKYAKKASSYKKKIDKDNIRIAAEKIFYGPQPTRSGWGGKYYSEVKRYLEKVMNDPSSLDISNCSDVYRIKDEGWGVYCQYRGKNAFGALIMNQNWFIIRQNQVIAVKDANAYSIN